MAIPRDRPAKCGEPRNCPIAAACASTRHVPCIDMARAHEEKLTLCGALEAIADDLPSRVDRLRCLSVASSLVPLLRACQRFEEETVFPAFEAADASSHVVDRLRAEHFEDECAAQDLTDILLATGHGDPIGNPEAFGYMLRAFFGSVRRHVAFERDHILPAVAAALEERGEGAA